MTRLSEGMVMHGPAGTATEVLIDDPEIPDWQATVAVWILDCPGQSPAWRHYFLSIVHLRDIDGVQPANIRVPGATHEVLLAALNPEANPTTTDLSTWALLHPLNLVEQVQLPDDTDARELLTGCVRAVLDGVLWAEPPLSGQVEPWFTTLIRTAAHLRGEQHAP